MSFKPNYELLKSWDETDKSFHKLYPAPYVSVFEKDGKTLIYMCDSHGANESFDMVDACFGKLGLAHPDILLTEFEHDGREMTSRQFQVNSLAYAAGVAAQENVPVVFADLSKEEMLGVLRAKYPNRTFEQQDLDDVLRTAPMRSNGEKGEMNIALNLFGRNRFMLDNIAAALNKYNVVFAIFGAGHYEEQRLALIDMMGQPKYITKIPNARGDFSKANIQQVKLVDFQSRGQLNDTDKTCQNSGGQER